MSQGEGGGRPPKFKTVKELEGVLASYFKECEKKGLMPSKVGARVFLHISKATYNVWKGDKHRFLDTIKRVDDLIEYAWVQNLNGNNVTGSIFYLKNAFKEDYKDKHEYDHTTKGKAIDGFNYLKYEADNNTNNKAGSSVGDTKG